MDGEGGLIGLEDKPAGPGAYRVLARKYRPRSFDDLIGQEPMVRTLINAFRSGRIAQAFMLTGVRGVGKTTTARILARALNYSVPGKIDRPTIDMPELGEHCAAIIEGRHVDVIEMDAASNTGIDSVREITEASRYRPAVARYKVYIIDEVHMLSTQAFNGLLKTLEEPPEHVKFILATTEIRKVPVTVLSRCQRFDLRRIDGDRLVGLLDAITAKEAIEVDPTALAMIARAAEGSARDALSLLDQAAAHGAGLIAAETIRGMLGLADRARVIDLFEQLMRGDIAAALAELADQYHSGADPAAVLRDLASFTHLVTRLKIDPSSASDASLTEEERLRGADFAARLSIRVLARAWQMLLKGIEETEAAARPLASADMVLVRLAYAAELPTPDEVIRRLRDEGAESISAPPAPPISPGSSATSSPTSESSVPDAIGRAAGEPLPPAATPPPSLVTSSAGGAPSAVTPRGGSVSPLQPPHARAPVAMAASAGAQAARMPSPALVVAATPAPAPPSAPPSPALLELAGFDDLVALAAAKRDLPLKIALERNVRPIHFEPGRIELQLTEDAPQGFVTDLGRRLLDWTGRRWVIAVGNGPAAPTIHERREARQVALVSDARGDPVVAAVLARFPGAEIVDVRMTVPEGEAFSPDSPDGEPIEPDDDEEED